MSDIGIRIGALVEGEAMARAFCAMDGGPGGSGLEAEAPLGLESWCLSFWQGLGGAELGALADSLLGRFGMPPSALSVFGNPLAGDEAGQATISALDSLIEAAPRFGATLVSTFAGRLPGRSVPDSIPAWKEAFAPRCERAAALGLSIAFENCRFGDTWKTGRWNLAMNPDAWELMFDALPGAPIGLEWEPAHQLLAFADPLMQLEAWVHRVLHVHAKDARIDRGLLGLHGAQGSTRFGRECLAGQGDTDWVSIFRILEGSGYSGSVDIEIGSTPGYEGDRAFEGITTARGALLKARDQAAPPPLGP